MTGIVPHLSHQPAALPRPVTGWRKLLRDALTVTGAGLVCDAIGVVTSLLLRMLLDPAQMGVWQGLKMLLGYGNFANLGVSKGAARELCVNLGRGDASAADRCVAVANAANVLASGVYAAALMVGAVWMLASQTGPHTWAWSGGLLTIAALTFLQRHVTFQITLLRCRQQFGCTSALALFEAGLTLLVGGLATWRFGLVGLYGATLAVMLASTVALSQWGAGRSGWRWSPREMLSLAGVGGPILAASVLAALFRSLDRWFVLALPEGEFQLGCYSAALLVTTQIYGVGNALSIVLAPRYGELLGRSGCRQQVARLAARSLEPVAAGVALAASLATLAAPPVLGALLPEYQPGLVALRWLIPGTVLLVLSLPLHQWLIAVGRERHSVAALAACLAVAALGNFTAVRLELGLVGIAATTAAAYGAYWLLLFSVSMAPALSHVERGRLLCAAAVATGLPILAGQLAAPASASEAGWQALLATPLWLDFVGRAGLILLAWSAMLWIGWTRGGWRSAWRQEATP